MRDGREVVSYLPGTVPQDPMPDWVWAESVLRAAGLFLILYTGFVGYLGLRDNLQRPLVWAVIIGNAIWAVDSLLLLVSGWVDPTRAGHAFVIAQALVVLMYAEFQYVGLRRSQEAVA